MGQLRLRATIALTMMLALGGVPGAIAVPTAPAVEQPSADAIDRAISEGMRLFQEGSVESLRVAIGQFEQAVRWSRAAQKPSQEAVSLLFLGRIYSDLGEQQKALEFYNQGLPLYRAIEDRGGEATTLNNIGLAYSKLGEPQKALEFYNQALPLRRLVRDRRGEANTLNNIGLVYSKLGEPQKALEFYNQALPLRRLVRDRGGLAATINNIGFLFSNQNQRRCLFSQSRGIKI